MNPTLVFIGCFFSTLNVWLMTEAFAQGWYTDALIHTIGAVAGAYAVYRYTGEE